MRIALTGGDAILAPSRTPAEVMERAASLPVADFRGEFGVAPNLSLTLAGEIVASVSGKSWEEFVAERLLGPLGMPATKARVALVKASGNLAVPHRRADGTTTPVEPEGLEHMMGAGALYSTASDVGQWIRLHLGQGRHGGQTIVSEASLRELHTPQALSTGKLYQGMFNPHASVLSYGLGWVISDYKGHKVVEHGGVNGGYTAYITLVPGRNTGFAVLTNLNMRAAWQPIQDLKFRLLDAVIEAETAAVPSSPR
jgi:CubicO group peptidase (beta-lactamase class C family)